MSDVEVKGVDGGCLNVEMGVNGNVKLEECNLSSLCSGGSGMKGGGMKISVGKGGSLEMKGVKYSGCEVPREDVEEGGRGMGGGMFIELTEEIGSFVMEGMEFKGCDGWKGKNMNAVNTILIDGECLIGGVCEIGDLRITSLTREATTIHFNIMIEEYVNGGSLIVFVHECVVERCEFAFEDMFEWEGESIAKEKNGRLEISECLFSSATMDLVMKSRIVSVESGELKMTETAFDGIHTTEQLLSMT
ncbi:uncharacterized protein MONOS_6915 [Monocercomonoides exilis]|uniref:uncharacterized protein n=1 Tax=Monocercomonoides exilis TaxID=2049356 RepID=UPI003559A97C|nr:hypothetical protein MONOS_6915 [Monocercomonoides exilis]|eukprot:MONOS_6915.1-p1 / transcript=MONOS_6915.1 / gene=MONOS_6915 / organism=Monocercomonoides_exilis_PA203 / gene_product=unspecified product / transcript_product=unspecified product / location=Mono_scaffold00226:87818-88813(+) / protein_length=247 / sequence_SO=supercontig / SO=protein_coding / is_pseudo=false